MVFKLFKDNNLLQNNFILYYSSGSAFSETRSSRINTNLTTYWRAHHSLGSALPQTVVEINKHLEINLLLELTFISLLSCDKNKKKEEDEECDDIPHNFGSCK